MQFNKKDENCKKTKDEETKEIETKDINKSDNNREKQSNIKEETKSTKETSNKTSFFKKVIMSIKDFDKYSFFANEKLGQSIKYIFEIMAIFTIIVTAVSTYEFVGTLNNVVNKISDGISVSTYSNGILTANENEKSEINTLEESLGTIILDTSDLTEEQVAEYKTYLNDNDKKIIALKDRIFIKNSSLYTDIQEVTYSNLLGSYGVSIDSELSKQDILNYYNSNQFNIYLYSAVSTFIYMFAIYVINIMMDCLLLGVLAFITSRIAKVKINFISSFNIAVHALTLPLILNIIYVIVNKFTGFTITYFQVMYTAIAYIYIATSIFMMKSDLIKRKIEIQKIEEEQEKVKKEIQNKEDQRQQDEKDKVKQEDKDEEKKRKSSENNNKKPQIGNKPEGDNA